MKTTCVLLAASACVVLGCEEKTPPQAPKASSPAPATQPAPSTPAPSTSPAPPAAKPASPAGPAAAAATSDSVSAAGFTFPLPSSWKSVPPGNSMRLAEIVVPDASGDAAKACLITFSSAGGEVQSNIDRWAGQVKDSEGQPSKPTVQKKTVAGVNVTIAEMTGSYAGMGDASPKPNTTLRGAIIEGPDAPLFIKMTGPADAMAAAAAGFSSMIDGMKK